MADLSMDLLPKNVSITIQVANALHFARGIQNIHLLNIEWHIGIPTKTGTNLPDFDFARKAWWVVMDGLVKRQQNDDYSVCIFEMRMAKASQMILSPLRATEKYEWFATVEVLGGNTPTNVQQFFESCQALSDALSANGFEYHFHWPKLWNDVHVNGKDVAAKQFMKDFVHKKVNGQVRVEEFKAIYDKIIARSDLKPEDYKMFSNETLDEIFDSLFRTKRN